MSMMPTGDKRQRYAEPCRHDDFVFDYASNEHVCEQCRLRWKDTGQSMDTNNYIFDRLLGGA